MRVVRGGGRGNALFSLLSAHIAERLERGIANTRDSASECPGNLPAQAPAQFTQFQPGDQAGGVCVVDRKKRLRQNNCDPVDQRSDPTFF
ncbi:hypothetical protein KL86SPO_31658 [uncultured Sporomusa sp.]|uniref:Uncharacterized protein n=1 Tax=uncultured Sporomusa sp. TaxID=307249 RepID=A0A212LVN9_9FIRM|nr:hypothetical protein KL86SPO_31658 [uncultured Sporomusa sp.]